VTCLLPTQSDCACTVSWQPPGGLLQDPMTPVFARLYSAQERVLFCSNEWVLIATCKQLVWSTRIGRNMTIWILDTELTGVKTGLIRSCTRAWSCVASGLVWCHLPHLALATQHVGNRARMNIIPSPCRGKHAAQWSPHLVFYLRPPGNVSVH
jgi:hypothetical protein